MVYCRPARVIPPRASSITERRRTTNPRRARLSRSIAVADHLDVEHARRRSMWISTFRTSSPSTRSGSRPRLGSGPKRSCGVGRVRSTRPGQGVPEEAAAWPPRRPRHEGQAPTRIDGRPARPRTARHRASAARRPTGEAAGARYEEDQGKAAASCVGGQCGRRSTDSAHIRGTRSGRPGGGRGCLRVAWHSQSRSELGVRIALGRARRIVNSRPGARPGAEGLLPGRTPTVTRITSTQRITQSPPPRIDDADPVLISASFLRLFSFTSRGLACLHSNIGQKVLRDSDPGAIEFHGGLKFLSRRADPAHDRSDRESPGSLRNFFIAQSPPSANRTKAVTQDGRAEAIEGGVEDRGGRCWLIRGRRAGSSSQAGLDPRVSDSTVAQREGRPRRPPGGGPESRAALVTIRISQVRNPLRPSKSSRCVIAFSTASCSRVPSRILCSFPRRR